MPLVLLYRCCCCCCTAPRKLLSGCVYAALHLPDRLSGCLLPEDALVSLPTPAGPSVSTSKSFTCQAGNMDKLKTVRK